MDPAQQAVNQATRIHEGASLSLAFKSEPGQIIVGALLERLVTMLDHFVMDPMSDDQVLKAYYEMKGLLGMLEDVGTSIQRATEAVMRNGVKQRLKVNLPQVQREEET
jgi:hypothetical protein